MKKINFLSSAKALTIAMMAMMALTTVSCSKDELPSPTPDVKPDTDQTVKFDATLTVNASMSYQKLHAADALIKLYQGKAGNTGTITYYMSDGQFKMRCETTQNSQTAFKQALKNVTAGEVDEVLKFTDATSVEFSVSLGNEAIVKYSYTETPAEGTWKGTSGGVDYSFELTTTKTAKGYYVASFTIDGQKVAGTAYKNGSQYIFQSDEKGADGREIYLAGIRTVDNSMKQVKITLMKSSTVYLLNDILFTK